MEIFVVAGEASADQHAADVIAALKNLRPDLHFFGMAGPKMEGVGVETLYSSKEISVVGIIEVLPKIPRLLKVANQLVEACRQRRPVCALLVDAPDFNLRLAKKIKRLGIPVVYYISPTVWAWRRGRIKTIRRYVDEMLCILPFEEDFYRQHGVNATYVGNPLVEQMPVAASSETFRKQLGLHLTGRVVALLPGSRLSEIRRLAPVLADTAQLMRVQEPTVQFLIPVASGLLTENIAPYFSKLQPVPQFIEGHAAEVVGASDGAIVASGTATLEAALMLRPLVAVYRLSWITYLLAYLLVKVAYFCLVNILAGKRVVPELLQGKATPENILNSFNSCLEANNQHAFLVQMNGVREKLGPKGAALRAAKKIIEVIQPEQK